VPRASASTRARGVSAPRQTILSSKLVDSSMDIHALNAAIEGCSSRTRVHAKRGSSIDKRFSPRAPMRISARGGDAQFCAWAMRIRQAHPRVLR